jgi:phage/plasmid-associated DNA primase
MSTGESMELASKHIQKTIQANPWTILLIMASNEIMDYGDQAQSLAWRMLIFSFPKVVKCIDTKLNTKLLKELPTIIIKGVWLCFELCNKAHKGVLLSYFHCACMSVQAETNPIVAFVNLDMLHVDPDDLDVYMPEKEFNWMLNVFLCAHFINVAALHHGHCLQVQGAQV